MSQTLNGLCHPGTLIWHNDFDFDFISSKEKRTLNTGFSRVINGVLKVSTQTSEHPRDLSESIK